MILFRVTAAFPEQNGEEHPAAHLSVYHSTTVDDFKNRDAAFDHAAQALDKGARKVTIQPLEVKNV